MRESKERVITSGFSLRNYWNEILEYKELFWILAKRDIIVRYKQTVFGIAWSIVRPLITAMVMVFAFGKVGNMSQGIDTPYILLVLPGVIVWLFFSQSLAQISMSIVMNNNLVSKVFFPRIIIPFSSFFLGLIDVVIAFILFLVTSLYFGILPDWKIVFVPIFIILSYLVATGIGLFAAVLNVKYRDIGQLIPFVIQFGMYMSPVAYLSEFVQNKFPDYYQYFLLNPVVGCIDGMRWAMLGGAGSEFNWHSFVPMIIFIFITIVLGIRFFRKHENSFVDYI